MRSQKSMSMFSVCSAADRSRGELATDIAKRMVEMEYRGFGDNDAALRRLSSRTGIGYSTWRNWWHGKATGVLSSTWEKLIHAYQVECARQAHLFQKELAQARLLSCRDTDTDLLRAAIAVAGDAVSDTDSSRRDMSSLDGARDVSPVRDDTHASRPDLIKLKLKLSGHRGV